MLLKNKTVVLTGSNRGIGKKILEIFSESGAEIFACSRNLDKDFLNLTNDLAKKYNNKITPIKLNLEREEDVKNAASEVLSLSKKIDILINNAGALKTALFQMTTSKHLREIFQINLFSQTIFTQILAKSMIKNKLGSIIYISSTSGIDGDIGRGAYSMSKSAVISQCKVLSRELGSHNIRVNAIAPGLIKTEMLERNTKKEIIEDISSRLSLKRVGRPNEVANVALFLASDLSNYITGQVLRVDGGM